MDYYPTLEEAKNLKNRGNLLPIYRQIEADLETPVSAFLKVAESPYSFLLESVDGGERLGRYSFIGTQPYKVLKTGEPNSLNATDPLLGVQQELDRYQVVNIPELPRFHGGAVGYLSYDVISYFEPRIPLPSVDNLGLPQSVFMFADTLLIFDHLQKDIKVISHARLDGDIDTSYGEAVKRIDAIVDKLTKPLAPSVANKPLEDMEISSKEIESNFSKEEYLKIVQRVKEYIYAGDVIQVVTSRRMQRKTNADPFAIYRALRTGNPSPYMYYLNLDQFQIVGASPEMLVRVEDNVVTCHPIAGTKPRGATLEEDAQLEYELVNSEKERAEHIMLVDLGRNDVGRVSEIGSVEVKRLMGVDRYSHVMHLVSEVSGKLKAGLTAFDAMRACFPAGTLSGAPKIRAMEIIAEMEGEQRGPYAGAVGYFGFSGNADTAITIRTLVLKDGVAYAQAGGGIVSDSDPEEEYQETIHKARAVFKAIEKAESI
ncbi:anthranilate synthase component I [SAR202 cluster bacterium AC-409-J13_OGT_754m]|nr:anthranilate synthase component I [SAR202 cluster bacterium AC-409-J13_OGT_754m]